jgi:CHAT domain-containing protein
LYTGLKANKGAFLKNIAPNLGDYSKIVFATHGYFGKGLPGINEPVLVFTLVPPGTDGYLRMSEVMGLRMNADVVALTACQTGLGKTISGEGTMGMGRAFQYAGAKSVLMSLWSVDEAASINLVESFFGHLRDGKNKTESLRLARDGIRKAGYDHPFFWSAFILVGETS